MTLKQQKLISAGLIALVVLAGFEALISIVNLNQLAIFWKTAFVIFIYLSLNISLLYDLHFKNPGALKRAAARHESVSDWFYRGLRIVCSAFSERFSHLFKKHHFLQFSHYLILPGLIFWASAALFYVNADVVGHRFQQVFALLSGLALVVGFWFLKEAFLRKTEKVEQDIFAALSAVKIYTSAIVFGAVLSLTRRYCLVPWYFTGAVFSMTFLLIYQALFQHQLVNLKNTALAAGISALEAVLAYFVYIAWGHNYYTAAIVMAACYNFMWGTFHYYLDGTLTKKVFFEILVICLLIVLMLFSVTNFKAKILNSCVY
ncbi:MAG: hypothetical protein HYZ51_00170 [Candidatus Doudnabacteria bacterium]|nr:hypothetical protein [Candidatus Doudnabacteria bacterium]